MILTAKPYISHAVYVLSFAEIQTKIRFEQQQAEAAFSGLVGTQSRQTNLPDDADFNQPRIFFASQKKSILIAQSACQLQMRFEQPYLQVTDQLAVVQKNVNEFCQSAVQFKSDSAYGQHGLVIEINIPSEANSNPKLQQHLHDRFIRSEQLGDVASIQFTLGYKIDELFLNISASVYEMRNLDSMPRNTISSLSSIPVQEIGINFKIDINNGPISSQGIFAETPQQLFTTVSTFLSEKFPSIFGFNLN
jgi:hypothetical protein